MKPEDAQVLPADEGRLEQRVRRLAPKPLKLTPAQAAMLRNERDGKSLFAGLAGRSAHGGALWTMDSLLRRGLLRRGGGLTTSGVDALALADSKTPNVGGEPNTTATQT